MFDSISPHASTIGLQPRSQLLPQGGSSAPQNPQQGELMTNTPRGEIALMINGQHYIIRPSFQCLCEIESATGKTILALAEKLADGQIALAEIACIIEAGIKAGSIVTVPREIIGRAIMSSGIATFLAIISEFFSIALTGETSHNLTKKKSVS